MWRVPASWRWRSLTRGKRVLIASFLLLLFAALPIAFASLYPSASARCVEAAELGEWRQARAACHESYARQGNEGDVILLAKAEMNLGNDGEAMRLARLAQGTARHADALAVVGVLLDRAGDGESARHTLHEAIDIFRTRGDAREVSRGYFALAGSFWRERRLKETLGSLDASFVSAMTVSDGRMTGYVALMRGDVLRAAGDARSAEREYELAAARLAGRRADMAYVHLKQGILRQEAGMLHLARLSFESALEMAQHTGREDAVAAARQNLAYNAHLEGDAAAGLAQLADWQGPFDSSYYSVRAVLEADAGHLTDGLAAMDRALELSRSNDDWWSEYERGRILERLGDDDGAEAGYERAIAVVEQMREAMDLSELQAWMIPRRRAPYEALLALHLRRGEPDSALRVLEAFSARSFMDAIIANTTIAHEEDDLRIVQRSWQRLDDLRGEPDDVAEALEGREILVPVEILGRLYVAYKSAQGEVQFVDRGDARHVAELASQFIADPDLDAPARELGRILVPDEIEPSDEILHIVPTGWLAGLPFAALKRGDKYLIEERPLAQTPSLRAFSMHRASETSEGILVIGDADGTLPAARTEALGIAEILGTRALVADDATRARLESAGSLELLHLGTHAGLSDGGAWLKLADGRWTVDAVLDCGVRADVVVLATCSSATTHHEELWGSLAIAFLANGSRSVVATLGSIDDRDTSEVVRALYRAGLRRDPVRALAAAQRTLARRLPPRAWGPFVIYTAGDNRPGAE